jgi:acetylcholinesterase
MQLYPNIPSEGVPYGRFDNETFPANGLQWRRVASIVGDQVMIATARLTAQVFSTTTPVYKYRFNVTNPIAGFPDFDGAAHGDEVNFVWNDPDLKTTPELTKVTDFMARSWVSFVVDLTPNNHGLPDIPVWEPYSSRDDGANIVIDIDCIYVETDDFRQRGIELLNRIKISTSQ